ASQIYTLSLHDALPISCQSPSIGPLTSDVKEFHVAGIALDEVAPGLHPVAHEHRERLVRSSGVVDRDLLQNPVLRVHRGLPELRSEEHTSELQSLAYLV